MDKRIQIRQGACRWQKAARTSRRMQVPAEPQRSPARAQPRQDPPDKPVLQAHIREGLPKRNIKFEEIVTRHFGDDSASVPAG